jgi:hypothetical protein
VADKRERALNDVIDRARQAGLGPEKVTDEQITRHFDQSVQEALAAR